MEQRKSKLCWNWNGRELEFRQFGIQTVRISDIQAFGTTRACGTKFWRKEKTGPETLKFEKRWSIQLKHISNNWVLCGIIKKLALSIFYYSVGPRMSWLFIRLEVCLFHSRSTYCINFLCMYTMAPQFFSCIILSSVTPPWGPYCVTQYIYLGSL